MLARCLATSPSLARPTQFFVCLLACFVFAPRDDHATQPLRYPPPPPLARRRSQQPGPRL